MPNMGIIDGSCNTVDYPRYRHYALGSTSLVAQGGGQSGIFTAGVLDAFLQFNIDPFDTFYGTSAGALNLLAFLSRQQGLGKAFILELTTDPRFFNLFSYIRRKQFMDLDWALECVTHYPYKLDLDMAKKTLKYRQAYAAVTEVSHIKDYYLPIMSNNWFDIMRASCAIPSLYKGEVEIEGKHYVDGGITASIPVQQTWRRGARNIIVIRTEVGQESGIEPVEIPSSLWLKEPIMLFQNHWNQQLDKWRQTWLGFWQEQIDKSKQVEKSSKRLDSLNGARWLFGAKDVYRLSHLLGGKFDSGLADLLMVHYQTYALTIDFLANPPDDCYIVQICPSEPLKSAALLSSKEDLLFDYEMGLAAGKQFVEFYSKFQSNKRTN